MDRAPSDVSTLLAQHGQEHLLTFWPELSGAQREQLVADLRSVDFDLVASLFRHGETVQDWAALAGRAESPPAVRLASTPAAAGRIAIRPTNDARRANDAGAEAIPHVAVLLVAGGQGTRLGFDHPKGMYPIGPLSGKSLFQILFEKILATGRRHGVRIPVFVMTSPATHDETAAYLEQHQRFGLAAHDVMLFCQGTMPAVDAATGRLLLAEKHRLALSPDGTGGIVAAMQRHGVLTRMRQRGVRHVFYMQVDNPLVSVCDPEFVGEHLLAGSEMSTQVVSKHSPLEPLGNVVSIDGKLHILEYSDLSRAARQHPEIAERRQPDGTSIFWAGNLGIHVIESAFLERVAESSGFRVQGSEATSPRLAGSITSLNPEPFHLIPFHIAKKKVPHIDLATGQAVSPARENAIKFERFVFDMLPAAEPAIVVEVDRRLHFAPLKNAHGAAKDTPEAVQAQMIDVHRQWLRDAGARLGENVRIEISPLWALDAAQACDRLKAGRAVSEDEYFA
jgi:UDP-N-acetylglucosamine/UDP-N-acetylgalactosamine diphosphorylase